MSSENTFIISGSLVQKKGGGGGGGAVSVRLIIYYFHVHKRKCNGHDFLTDDVDQAVPPCQ